MLCIYNVDIYIKSRYYKFMPKYVTYDIQKIISLLDLGNSWREINKQFGKPCGCVEKWLKRNKIQILKSPIRHQWVKLDRQNIGN